MRDILTYNKGRTAFRIGEIMLGLLIGLLSGAVGGNIAGSVLKSNYGTTGRSIIGVVGGTLLSFILAKLGIAGLADPLASASSGMPGLNAIIAYIVSGIAGGGVLTWVLGLLKK